jgi:lysophospholipid acyltransferase (LPLAT)-like uncharacterized protein
MASICSVTRPVQRQTSRHERRLGGLAPIPKNRAVPSSPENRADAYRITGWNRLILWSLGNFIRLWARTIRIRVSPESRAIYGRRDVPTALAMWHNRLFLGCEITRRFRPGGSLNCIVSASKDGAWMAGFLGMFGIKSIRGSNNWGAREAVNAMIKVAKEGGDLGITPDGPRGPIYEFKPGGLIVARRAKLPIVLIGVEFSRVKQLRSWDRFILPLPFSSATLNVRRVELEDLPKDRTAALAELSAIMMELNGDRH